MLYIIYKIARIAYIFFMEETYQPTVPISVRVNPSQWQEFKKLCRREGITSATAGINILILAALKKIVSLNELESFNKETNILQNEQNQPQSMLKALEELNQKVKALEELTQNNTNNNIAEDLIRVNQALRLCSIRQKGKRFYLRATLPLKQGTGRKSQEIRTGAIANKEGLSIAQSKAKKLESDLSLSKFQWSDWL